MKTLGQDLRYAIRMLVAGPGFSAVAILTIALGIGANTAIFSVVNGVLLRSLPFADPDRLVAIRSVNARLGDDGFGVSSPADFLDWSAQNSSFEDMAAYSGDGAVDQTGDHPEPLRGARVSADFFAMLGVKPLPCRTFNPA